MNRFKNFSESGGKTITAAFNIAGKMGHITAGTEHLLMGILSCGKSDARDLLGQYDITFSCVYNVTMNVLGHGQYTKLTEDDLSTNAITVLKDACSKAAQNGKVTAGVNDILYAIVTNKKCMAYQIILTLTNDNPDFLSKVEQMCCRKNTAEFSGAAKGKKEIRIIEKYSRNLTAQAKITPFDPCIGREKEIRQLMEILLRRQKNNPCLVGVAGVGKTAIVEGLANMIVEGNVPPQMKSKSIYAIDMSWLLAGTKYRGDFEERVKSLIEEASGDRDIILFIDEIHTIVSAGGAEGAIDAANILKPALSRGMIQVIGATTRDEYAQTIEKDAALDRRFCPVNVQEPSISTVLEILQGLKERYQEYHQITISDCALKACVDLSVKHIHNRFLPDKAVDLLDTCCACAKMEQKSKLESTDVENVVYRQKGYTKQKNSINQMYIQLADRIKQHIAGQDEAIDKIASAIRRWAAGLKTDTGPIASFLLCGPTGTGKTYTCKILADQLFPGKNAIVRIDCSEYSEKNSISKLTGSPPGYIGYDDGGILEKEVLAHNSCVVLFDEIEKAHPDLHNLLLQAMDNGFITTSRGKKISFENSVIAMTTNAAASLSHTEKSLGFENKGSEQYSEEKLHAELRNYFTPEFLGRINEILYFKTLSGISVKEIIQKKLTMLANFLAEKNISVEFAASVTEFIYNHSNCVQYGVRNINGVIIREIESKISDMILTQELKTGKVVCISAHEDSITLRERQTV